MKQKKLIFGFVAVLSLLTLIFSSSSAQESGKPPLKIVQIGDSYSAGNGARSAEGDRNYYGISGCYRSPTNWGSQFVASLSDTFAVTYINRACSGAKLDNIMSSQDLEDRVLKNLDGSCPTAEYEEELIVPTSTFQCSRFVTPQINAIGEGVNLVLMTMGGNDLDFDNIVMSCFVPYLGYRSARDCETYVEKAIDDLDDLQTELEQAFSDIRDELEPGAKIVYVSYPHLMLDVSYQIRDLDDGYIYNAGERIRYLATLGDIYQKAAVANANAEEEYVIFYEGTKELFAGHEPNPFSEIQNPDRWITELEGFLLLEVNQKEAYHPNALGHENWGEALSVFETFGAAPGAFDANSDIDVVFVVDTTGSMGGEIAQVQADIAELVDQLAATTDSYRVAVVSYRDFPERTGSSSDYPARVDQTFTSDLSLIQAAIDSLTAQGGGDGPETVFSGIQAAISLSWRPGVTKIAIVIGDAPALSPEPISNLTAPQIVANSIAVDPVQVVGVNVGSLNSNGALGEIADGTGGSIISGTSGLTEAILEILDQAVNQPFAWLGQAYSGKIGQPVQFDASGSFDPSGLPLTLYEWDFDGDGVYDLATAEATATHTYDAAFNNFVVLRVTGPGGTALASARTVVNVEGYALQGDEDPCELDENGYSIIFDEETGNFISCTPTNLPEVDDEVEIVGDPLEIALANLENAIAGLKSPLFGQKYDLLVNSIESGNTAMACRALKGMLTLVRIQAGKKMTQEEAAAVIEAVDAVKILVGCSG